MGFYGVGIIVDSIWYFCLRVCCVVYMVLFVCGIVLFVGLLLLLLLCLTGCLCLWCCFGDGCNICVLLVVLSGVC